MVFHNMLRDGDKTMLRHLKFEITGSSSSLVKFRELFHGAVTACTNLTYIVVSKGKHYFNCFLIGHHWF